MPAVSSVEGYMHSVESLVSCSRPTASVSCEPKTFAERELVSLLSREEAKEET